MEKILNGNALMAIIVSALFFTAVYVWYVNHAVLPAKDNTELLQKLEAEGHTVIAKRIRQWQRCDKKIFP